MRKLEIGRVYRHFKNKYYLVVGEALHSETDEKFVVYKQLYGEGLLYIRPYDMFLSEVDRNKYPDVKQKYRFECVNGSDGDSGRPDENTESPVSADADSDNETAGQTIFNVSDQDPEDAAFDRYYEEGGWREYRDDAEEYGLDPVDFATEEDFEEALEHLMAGSFQGY